MARELSYKCPQCDKKYSGGIKGVERRCFQCVECNFQFEVEKKTLERGVYIYFEFFVGMLCTAIVFLCLPFTLFLLLAPVIGFAAAYRLARKLPLEANVEPVDEFNKDVRERVLLERVQRLNPDILEYYKKDKTRPIVAKTCQMCDRLAPYLVTQTDSESGTTWIAVRHCEKHDYYYCKVCAATDVCPECNTRLAYQNSLIRGSGLT